MAVLQASTINSIPVIALPSGTSMPFQQSSAPTGWTKSTSYNDAHMRIVNGSVGSGGSQAFSSVFASKSFSTSGNVSVSAMTLATNQIPSHAHWCSAANIDDYNFTGSSGNGQYHGLVSDAGGYSANDPNYGAGRYSLGQGSGGSHDHGSVGVTVSGNAINLAIKYVDCIIATKN
jgi:hypothetical protein